MSEIEKQDRSSQAQSMWRIVLAQFFEHKGGVVGLAVIVLLVLVAVFSPVLSAILGQNPDESSIQNRYLAPMEVTAGLAVDMEEHLESFIEENSSELTSISNRIVASGILSKSELAESGGDEEEILFILMEKRNEEGVRVKIAASDLSDFEAVIYPAATFGKAHLLGTDEVGRDILIRLIYGTRISLTVGLSVAILSGVLGLLIGSFAGYYGGVLDGALMRVTDSMIALPLIPVLIILAAIDFQNLPLIGSLFKGGSSESVIKMIVILCSFSWMTTARLVRGSVLTVKNREYVLAAKTMGARDYRIIIQHVTPNVIAPLLVAITLGVGNAILFESALSFLGLGIQPPIASWGNMLTNAQELIHEAPLLAIMPGTLIFIIVICFNFVGDALQGAIDPRSIKR